MNALLVSRAGRGGRERNSGPFCVKFCVASPVTMILVMIIQVDRGGCEERESAFCLFLSMVLLDMVHPLIIMFVFRSRKGGREEDTLD